MLTAIKLFWSKYFVLNERTRRKHFWFGFLFFIIVSIIISNIFGFIIDAQSNKVGIMISYVLMYLLNLILFIGMYTLSVRRFHDVGRTLRLPTIYGILVIIYNIFQIVFYQNSSIDVSRSTVTTIGVIGMVIVVLSLIFSIIVLVYTIADSEAGSNQYGENPKNNNEIHK